MIKKTLNESLKDSNGVININDAVERIYDLLVWNFPNEYDSDKTELANKLEKRKQGFYDTLVPFLDVYTKEMIREFFDFWSETNRSKTKMAFERKPTWEVAKRLRTWASRSNMTCIYRKPATHPFSKSFDAVWERWKKYKREEFKYYYNSDDAEQSAMNLLISISKTQESEAVKIVDHTIACGYKTFYGQKEKEQKDDGAKFQDAKGLLKVLGGI